MEYERVEIDEDKEYEQNNEEHMEDAKQDEIDEINEYLQYEINDVEFGDVKQDETIETGRYDDDDDTMIQDESENSKFKNLNYLNLIKAEEFKGELFFC